MKCCFDALKFPYPTRHSKPTDKVLDVVGIDSEAYETGEPFMFALSDGTVCEPSHILRLLLMKRYRGKAFVCYNMKYDEGALLYMLPTAQLDELRTTNKVEYEGFRFRVIPRKQLVISRGHKSAAVYDIAQFYATSLDKAARRYLGESKYDMETLHFTHEYVREHWQTIASYCVQDAVLAQRLARYFTDTLIAEFNIYPQKLYSTGYISGMHFARVCDAEPIDRFVTHHRSMTTTAYDSYSGGKFETYQRGFGYFYQYDINSAYPAEIRNLKSTVDARVVQDTRYRDDADYGFMRCDIIHSHQFSPVPVKRHTGVNIYPAGGLVNRAITKREYEYLVSRGARVRIRDAYWLYCQDRYPYREEIDRLYELKYQFKGTDEMRYLLTKLLMNAFYGKLIQVTEKPTADGSEFQAGYLFHPMYAAVITANVRVRTCEVCDMVPDHAIAVHTDSIITSCDMSAHLPQSGALGEWDFVRAGEGVIVGCGIYQIGDVSHYRGYRMIESLADVVSRAVDGIVEVPQRMVLPWRLVAFRNDDHSMVNRFVTESKQFRLDFDTKREWSGSFGTKLVNSMPLVVTGC